MKIVTTCERWAALWRDLPLLHQMDLMVIFGGVSSNDVLLEKLESWIKQKRESAAEEKR